MLKESSFDLKINSTVVGKNVDRNEFRELI